MGLYVGLDVSQKQTWICVVDDKGKTIAQGGSLTRASDIAGWLGNRLERADIVKIGLEAGTMSSWLYYRYIINLLFLIAKIKMRLSY